PPPELVSDQPPAAALQDRRAADPHCAVLRGPARRESLAGEPLPADSRAYRATRVAPDVIPNTGQGAGAMSSGGNAAVMSLNGTVRVTNREASGSHRPQGSSEGRPSSCREGWKSFERGDRRDGLRGGRRHGGGNRSISEIPAERREFGPYLILMEDGP